jgi:hypothetical protein
LYQWLLATSNITRYISQLGWFTTQYGVRIEMQLYLVLPPSGLKIADRPDWTDFGLDRTA